MSVSFTTSINELTSALSESPIATVFDKAHGMVTNQSAYREMDGVDYAVLWPSSLTEFNVL
jgi:hypothetical protein